MTQKEQDYKWVLDCLLSCVNPWQLGVAYKMITAFKIKHEDEKLSDKLVEEYIVMESKFMV